MSRLTDHCVCLRQRDYSETSQVLTLFGERHGRHSVIAKGIKRGTKTRFATGIDVLEKGHCVISPPRGATGLGTLVEWEQIGANTRLRRRLDTLNAGLYAAELAAALTEEADPHPAMYAALVDLLEHLPDAESVKGVLVGFQAAALRDAGLSPRMDECVGCDRAVTATEPIFFSSSAGGLLCRDCEPFHVEKRRISMAARAGIVGSDGAPGQGAQAAFEVLDYHVSVLLDRPMRLARTLTTGK